MVLESTPARQVPSTTEDKMLSWRHWGVIWSLIYYLVGVSSATLSVVAATTAKDTAPSSYRTVILAALAAGLTFLLTALDAGKKANQFQSASRHLEAAIALYVNDPSLDDRFLGTNEAEALNKYLT